jgi:hypothetical protein
MARRPVIPALPELTTPSPGEDSSGQSLLQRVNPLTILVGMGMATAFAWFLTGGGGTGNGRRPTHQPKFRLGEDIGGHIITGIRTRWEYEVDDRVGWLQEETL